MKKKTLRKLAVALPLSIAAVIGVACAVQDYQGGAVFQPFASDRALQSNQVLFPDDGERTEQGMGDETDDSALWEKDREAEEASRPQQQDRADYLFQDNTPDTPSSTLAGTTTTQGTTRPSKVPGSILDIVGGDGSNADLIIGGGSQPGGTLPGGNPGTGEAPTPPDEDTPSGPVPPTPPPTPTPTPTPTPAPTPDPTPKPDQENNGGGGGSAAPTPAPKPNYSETAKDPETPKGEPSESGWGDATNIQIDSTSPRPGDKTEENTIITLHINMSDPCPLYWGRSVDALTVFRALDTYVSFTKIDEDWNISTTNYYWGESQLNKLFRIDGVSFDGGETYSDQFPMTIPKGLQAEAMKIQVSYRYDTSENWISYEEPVSCTPKEARLYVLSEQLNQQNQTIDSSKVLNSVFTSDKFPAAGSWINMFYYQKMLLEKSMETTDKLEKLFPGWLENDQIVPFSYPVSSGRHVLEPASLVDYDSSLYDLRLASYYVDANYQVQDSAFDDSMLCSLQTLMDYGDTLESQSVDRLVVPQYVQAVELVRLFGKIEVKELVLPSSVIYVNTKDPDTLSVRENYVVDSANPKYTSQDGILFSKDMTQLLAVPTERETLEIPASVESVTLPGSDCLTKLVFQGTNPDALPEVNFEDLAKASKLVVKPEVLDRFLQKNRTVIENRGFQVSDTEKPNVIYTVKNGMVLRNDGSLSGLMPSEDEILYLPNGIEKIDSDALQGQNHLNTIVMPADGTVVKTDSALFEKYTIKNVICYNQNQAEAIRAVAPEGITIQTCRITNGYTYFIIEENKAVLLSAPETITEFTGTELGEEISICEIGNYAFTHCKSLRYVTLPESVKHIGTQAFYGCDALEGLLIDSRDRIVIGDKAWDNCPALRFVASNAAKAVRQNNYDPTLNVTYTGADRDSLLVQYLFCLPDQSGYSEHWMSFEDPITHFVMVDVGGGSKALCGANEQEGAWFVARMGKTMPKQVELPPSIRWFYCGSFSGTVSSDEAGYTINWEALTANAPNQANLGMNAYAFAHSDLAGTITLPGNVDFDDYAFAYCDKLTSVDFSGTISRLGENLFMEDKALSEVRFGTFASPPAHGRNELSNRQFSGCDKLQRIEFTSATPPTLGFLGMGDAYAFTSTPEQDEKNKLTLTVPEESKQAYLDAWRYAFAGYEDTTINGIFKPAYQSMRENIKHTSKNISDEEVDAKIYQTLLSTENRLRGLLGMEKITKLDHLYNWKTTWGDDLFILTSAYTDATEITLDAKTLDLPEGWSIDYIGSHAFANAPNLTQVTADANTMLALYSGAFADAENHPITLIFTGDADPNTMGVGLVPAGDGKRFDFTGLEKVVLPKGTEQIFLDLWLYPTSGYEDYADLYLQTADELYEKGKLTDNVEKNKELIDARMAEIMLPYENQLRQLFGMEETYRLTASLSEYHVDVPDGRDWEDLVQDVEMNNGTNNGSGEDDLTESPAPGQDNDGDTPEPDIPPGQGSSDQTNQNQTTPDQTGEDKKPEETEGETTDRQDPPKPETAQPDGPEPVETPGSTTETEEAAS